MIFSKITKSKINSFLSLTVEKLSILVEKFAFPIFTIALKIRLAELISHWEGQQSMKFSASMLCEGSEAECIWTTLCSLSDFVEHYSLEKMQETCRRWLLWTVGMQTYILRSSKDMWIAHFEENMCPSLSSSSITIWTTISQLLSIPALKAGWSYLCSKDKHKKGKSFQIPDWLCPLIWRDVHRCAKLFWSLVSLSVKIYISI